MGLGLLNIAMAYNAEEEEEDLHVAENNVGNLQLLNEAIQSHVVVNELVQSHSRTSKKQL